MKIVDANGYVWASLLWNGPHLTLDVPGAHVDCDVIEDPLLGPAHVITSVDATTAMSAIDWSRPTTIPTIAAPGALPSGAGGAIMNAIATIAREAGVPALRYAGRYPTAALYRTLLRSFRTDVTEEAFTSHFKLGGPAVEIPIDFVPAPFQRLGNPHGYVELREELVGGALRIERAVVDRVSYEIDGSPSRLVLAAPDLHRAELWFGDAPYAHVASFDADGKLAEGPLPLPRCEHEVIGQVFPADLLEALAELVSDAVPAPLREDARKYLAGTTLRWADLGARPATATSDGLAVHAVLWERIAPLGLPRLALALAEALAPVVTARLVTAIAADADLMSPTN
ncbi:MAG: hypothetical protein M4D80_20930 [Myxococcota bacterium]|nr:hypothetical protein [Myxococcota bacterium]